MKPNVHKRHIAKAITWRIIGTLDTILLSWFITGSPFAGVKIGLIESITKIVLYYLHERFWYRSSLHNANKRHLVKTVTWRIVATLDTVLIAWFITGNPLTGLKIGFAEVITKMFLYYIHEKVWYKFNFGLNKRKHNTYERQ